MINPIIDSQDTAIEQETTLEEREEKTFTQEEVNRIVQRRLKEKKDEQKAGQDISIKAAELEQREIKLECKEYLIENGYPKELLDIIPTNELKGFKEKADVVYGLMKANNVKQAPPPLAQLGERCGNKDDFANVKHVPKKY